MVKRMLVINNSPIGKRDHIKLPEMLTEMSEAKRQLNVNQSEHFFLFGPICQITLKLIVHE